MNGTHSGRRPSIPYVVDAWRGNECEPFFFASAYCFHRSYSTGWKLTTLDCRSYMNDWDHGCSEICTAFPFMQDGIMEINGNT